MKTKLLLLAVTIILTVIISGCQNSVNTMQNVPPEMQLTAVQNKKIITDSILAGRVKVVRLNSEVLPTGFMKVQAALRSERVGFFSWLIWGNEPYKIAYRFTWFNHAGMKVDTAASTWIPMEIMPGDVDYISGVAPTEQCNDFIIKLKQI